MAGGDLSDPIRPFIVGSHRRSFEKRIWTLLKRSQRDIAFSFRDHEANSALGRILDRLIQLDQNSVTRR